MAAVVSRTELWLAWKKVRKAIRRTSVRDVVDHLEYDVEPDRWIRRLVRKIQDGSYEPPTDGRGVRLSLDMAIQTLVEAELADVCQKFGARTGQMIMMQPFTGEILAMANYPPFDPANVRTSSPEQWRNRCVTDAFEPGSTFKPFVWSMATQARVARGDEIIDCHQGYYVSPQRRHLRNE